MAVTRTTTLFAMKALQLSISGSWGHFRKPETNRTPLTHDFITKTAFIGMMGAVVGVEREEMRPAFPKFSEDLLYGVRLRRPVQKEPHGFITRSAKYPGRTHDGSGERLLGRKRFEFLKKPHFQVAVALQDERSGDFFDEFLHCVESGKAQYTPVLGWHNCPANLSLVSSGTFADPQTGAFEASCFVSNDHHVESTGASFHIGIDRIPTYQENFWNRPDYYETVLYPFGDHLMEVEGEYFEYDNGECWWLT